MDNSLKTQLFDLLAARELRPAVTQLLDYLEADHPAASRTRQLEKRLRELEGRMEMGTLSPVDIDRTQSRIAGGLREIILDYKPYIAPAAAPVESRKEAPFTLATEPEAKLEPDTEAPDIGFRGTVVYAGSPSKKEQSITLPKSYGAAYHAAVQAVRKCGMDMQKGDRPGGRIHATTTGNTMARFGEVIHLWVIPVERATTRIHVVVDSANPDTVFDMGRHQQKLDALLHQLRNA